MRTLSLLTLILLTLTLAATALADVIVDTGKPTGVGSDGFANQIIDMGGPMYDYQAIAVQFTLNKGFTLTNVYGYMDGNGSVKAVIYGNSAAGAPDMNVLDSGIFSVSSTKDWQGFLNAGWTLQAGTYWLAFEPVYSFQGNFYDPPPTPQAYSAVGQASSIGGPVSYSVNNAMNVGIQLSGTPSVATPEPSTYLLLCISLGAVGVVRRKMARSKG
jgi:PEP-CTERM motif